MYKKRSDWWLPVTTVGAGELEEDGPKAHTSSFKINQYEGCNVQMTTIAHAAIWHIGDLLRE